MEESVHAVFDKLGELRNSGRDKDSDMEVLIPIQRDDIAKDDGQGQADTCENDKGDDELGSQLQTLTTIE